MFVCKVCGYKSIVKLGKCPGCNTFGSFEKEKEKETIEGNILQFNNTKNKFYDLENKEFKRVFTNGIKSNGVYLLGGQPGIGKSTLVLQIIASIKEKIHIVYFSGEEESSAITSRLKRITDKESSLKIYHAKNLENILQTAEYEKSKLIIIDSIQTIFSKEIQGIPGSINQIKFCSEKISDFCKKNNVAAIIIGHITKSGEIAGPKYLEHIVDVVAYLEGDRFGEYRFLRTQKNRFGPTNDTAIFQMTKKGLESVYDIKKNNIFDSNVPGSILTVGIDNGRPILTTLETLLNKTSYKFPKRTTIGVNPNRVELIIAILEKYLKLNLSYYDIFINIPGEFKFLDSGLDLAISAGIFSAYKNIKTNYVFIGEISLSGLIQKSKFHEKRKKEANMLSIVDYTNLKHIKDLPNFFKNQI